MYRCSNRLTRDSIVVCQFWKEYDNVHLMLALRKLLEDFAIDIKEQTVVVCCDEKKTWMYPGRYWKFLISAFLYLGYEFLVSLRFQHYETTSP